MNELAGQVALVTGGSRGVGAAIARRLAQAGAAVAFTYVSAADKAQAVAKQIDADGGTVLVIQADNADPGAVTAAVEQTVQQLNPADLPAASALSQIPALGRYGLADDIARTVVHLAGDGGRYVTGTAITVDGGFAA